MSTVDDAKRRILAMCPPEQMSMVDFELRMLATSLESESLQFIHQHWRPIADERDQLRAQVAELQAKPSRKSADDTDLPARFGALTNEHQNLKKKNAALSDRNDDLQAELLDLREAYKKLQADCDDLLNDQRPARNAS